MKIRKQLPHIAACHSRRRSLSVASKNFHNRFRGLVIHKIVFRCKQIATSEWLQTRRWSSTEFAFGDVMAFTWSTGLMKIVSQMSSRIDIQIYQTQFCRCRYMLILDLCFRFATILTNILQVPLWRRECIDLWLINLKYIELFPNGRFYRQ